VILRSIIPNIISGGLMLAFAGILFAPALASLGVVACLFSGLFSIIYGNSGLKIDSRAWALLIFWLLAVTLLHSWNTDAGRLLLLKLPVLCMPIGASALGMLRERQLYRVLSVWVWLLYGAATSSIMVYLSDVAWYHQLVLESKPMPVLARMHHIEFSLFLAASVWAGLILLNFRMQTEGQRIFRMFTLMAAAANLIMLHFLSARTGLLAFYIGSAIWLVAAFRTHRKKMLMGGLALLLAGTAALAVIPSLRNRVMNTLDDLRTVTQNQDPNDKSFAQRWEAWGASIYMLKQHPVTGVGLKEIAPDLSAAHEAIGSQVLPWNRKMPHNQYLETGIQGGIPAILLLLAALSVWFWQGIKERAYFFTAMLGLLCSAFMFESLLEQQSGVLLCTLCTLLAASADRIRNKPEEPLHL
jgi:O-antigen ligase